MTADEQKRAAAAEAIKLVRPDMTLGLGTGSTAAHFIDLLGEKVSNGLSVTAIPTSEASGQQAQSLGIELIEPDETTQIDLAVDGADEVGPGLALIKRRRRRLVAGKKLLRKRRGLLLSSPTPPRMSLSSAPSPCPSKSMASPGR